MQTILSESEDFRIIGQAVNGADAIAQALELEPDLLITDFFLPDMDGIEVIDSLLSPLPNMAVVIISSHDTEVIAAIEVLDQTIAFLPKTGLNVPALRNLRLVAEGQ